MRSLLAHPLQRAPYNAVKFSRFDHFGTPVFTVSDDVVPRNAKGALKAAFERFGGNCFHCKTFIPAGDFAEHVTLDHVRPLSKGGTDELHNLVLACKHCNRMKGDRLLARFSGDRGDEYLVALDIHLTKCAEALRDALESEAAQRRTTLKDAAGY